MNAGQLRKLGFGLVMLNCLGISGKSVFIPLLYQAGLNSGEIVLGRLVFAIPAFWFLFMLLAPKQDRRIPSLKEWAVIAGLSSISAIPIICHTIAYSMLSPAVASVIVYIFPVFVVALEWILFKQRPTRRLWVVILLVYLGMGILAATGNSTMKINDWKGIAYTVVAALSFAFYLVLQPRSYAPTGPLRLDPIGYCAWSSLVIPAAAIPFIRGDIQSFAFLGQRDIVCLLGGFSLISTAIPFVSLLTAVRLLGATTTSLASTITPGLSVIATAIFLGDRLSASQYIGVLIVIAGLALLGKQKLGPSREEMAPIPGQEERFHA